MNDKVIDNLNEILRGERAAVETYIQVMDKVNDDPKSDQIMQSKADHIQAVQELKNEITTLGGTPSEDSGAWGSFAQTVTGAAKIFGDKSALKALKEGEEHGLKLYQDFKNEFPQNKLCNDFASKFIPRQKTHIAKVDKFIEQL